MLYFVCIFGLFSEFKMGNAVDDQQLGCLWQGEWLLSVSLSGSINYLDKDNPSKPLRVLRVCDVKCLTQGHALSLLLQGQNQNLNSIAVSKDSTTVYSGSVEGRVNILSFRHIVVMLFILDIHDCVKIQLGLLLCVSCCS